MKDVQCHELFRGIALKNHAFSFFFHCEDMANIPVLSRNNSFCPILDIDININGITKLSQKLVV